MPPSATYQLKAVLSSLLVLCGEGSIAVGRLQMRGNPSSERLMVSQPSTSHQLVLSAAFQILVRLEFVRVPVPI